MTPSKILILLTLGFLAGVFVGSFLSFSWLAAFVLLLAAAAAFVIGSKRAGGRAIVLGFLIVFVFIGFARASLAPAAANFEEIQIFERSRLALAERSQEIIGGQEQALFAAMVFGYTDNLSAETKEVFNRTGTRHLIAISGMNLTIVAALAFSFLIFVGFWRRWAFYVALAGVVLFVLLVGAPASAVRAGIMAGLFLLSRHLGRLAEAWRLLLLAAFLMVILNPRVFVFDLGFQLSFLAVLGLIAFTPFFERLLQFIPLEPLRQLISMSLAAQVTTWPLIASTFKTFSVIGPLANIVTVPLMPLVMIFGLLFLVFGWWSLLAKVVLWPAWLILHFVSSTLSWLNQFKYASVDIAWFGIIFSIIYYILLVLFYWRFVRKDNNVRI